MQKFIQILTKTRPIFDGFAQFLYKFLPLKNTLTSKDVQRGCHNVLRGHGILKKQEFVQKSPGVGGKHVNILDRR